MPQRTRLLLGVLAFLVLASAWVTLRPEDDDAAGDRVAPPTSPISRKPSVERVEELETAPLAAVLPGFTAGRDPWRFHAASAILRHSGGASLQKRVDPVPVEPVPQAQTAVAVASAPFPWVYLGSFGSAQRRIAVFVDGPAVVNVQEGEVLAGGFVLHRIGWESVEVRRLAAPDVPGVVLKPGSGGVS